MTTSKKIDYFFPDPGLVERRLRLRQVYKGRAVAFHADTVRLPNKKTATREYLHHHGAVGVLPFLDRRTIILVRQYRYPVGEVTLEMPAGKLDPGEDHLVCLKRELREETGYTARRIRHLIDYWPTCAFSDELLRLYIADGLKPGRISPDYDEFIEAVAVPYKEALDLVWKGRIKDSKTIIALIAARRFI